MSLKVFLGTACASVLMVFSLVTNASTNPIQSKVKELISFYQDSKSLKAEESRLIQDFLYRLSFKIHTLGATTDERKVLLNALDQILLDSNLETHPKILTFAENLSQALKDHLEPKEDAFAFIKNFISFSGIDDPKDVNEFFEKQDYVNKKSFITAQNPMFEEAGQFAILKTEPQVDLSKINLLFDFKFQSNPTN